MGRYIDVDAFLAEMIKTPRYFTVKFDILNFPTSDVAPVRHAHWIFNGTFGNLNHHSCSACLKDEFRLYRYCPNCGAKMDEEDKQ